MINLVCKACGALHDTEPQITGNTWKCTCGTIIVVPTPSTNLSPAPSGTICPHCNSAIQPAWKSCPACGGTVPLSQVIHSKAQTSVGTIQTSYGQSSATMPPSSDIQIGNDSFVKSNVNQSINVVGDSSLPKSFMGISGQLQSGNIPTLQVGDGSVVKAEIDASVNYTNQGQIIGQQNIENKTVHNTTVIHESGFAKLVNMVSSSNSLGADETDKLMDRIGDNPYQLMILVVSALNSLSRTLSNYSKDNFKEISKGFRNMHPTAVEIYNKIELSQRILNRINENISMCHATIAIDIAKADDIIRHAKNIHYNYVYLSDPICSLLLYFFSDFSSKKKNLISLIQSETDCLVQKYK